MSKKQITGLVVGVLGLVMTFFSWYAMTRLSQAKGTVNQATSPFGGSIAGDMAKDTVEGKLSQYDTPIRVILGGGILMVIIGGFMACCSNKKKPR